MNSISPPVVLALVTCLCLGVSQSGHAADYLFTTICGSPGLLGTTDGTNRNARFSGPTDVALAPNGDLFATDPYSQVVRKISREGEDWIVSTIAGSPYQYGTVDGTNGQARFSLLSGIAVDRSGTVFVTDSSAHVVRKLNRQGQDWVVTTIAGAPGIKGLSDGLNGAARFYGPAGVAVDSRGTIYIVDEGNRTLRKVVQQGTNWVVSTFYGEGFERIIGITLDRQDNIYVTYSEGVGKLTAVGGVWRLEPVAGLFYTAGSADGTNFDARFFGPRTITSDDRGNLYVAESLNNTIRKIVLGQVPNNPGSPIWIVSTVGGLAGQYGTADGIGSAARFNYPMGIASDSAGTLFIADQYNQCIRRGSDEGGTPDNLYPVAQCRLVIAFADTNGLAEASIQGDCYDPDGDPITVTQSPPGPYHLGTNLVNLTVTDDKGASSTCVGTILVLDPTPPQILEPSADHRFTIGARGGQVVVVEVSTNLVDWTPISTNTVGTDSSEVSDNAPKGAPATFSRLRLWP